MSTLQDAIYDLTDTTQKELCQNEFDSLKTKMNFFFKNHETFMVRLCEVLKLDYLEVTEEDVIEKIKELMQIENSLEE